MFIDKIENRAERGTVFSPYGSSSLQNFYEIEHSLQTKFLSAVVGKREGVILRFSRVKT